MMRFDHLSRTPLAAIAGNKGGFRLSAMLIFCTLARLRQCFHYSLMNEMRRKASGMT